ncbi:MAG: RagB/SusD family nutrient uptake outer membrane protein [Chitinophagaceae bacterium]|nr:RagB/SusD family nutrient uptake outer membrane protein [Chitinophagaceae bacterium]
MKKYIPICIALGVLFSSCDKKLDLLPQQSVAEEVALSSDANVKKVLNGAYDALSDGDLYGGNIFLFSELLGANGELRWEGTFNQPREIWMKAMLTTNSYVRDTWLGAYNTINIANNILSATSVVNTADQNRVKGEALFIRASMYFELVKLYAKPYSAGSVTSNPGVPLILTPTRGIDANSFVARNTVEQVYAQILTDLNEAESLLPNSNGVFASKPAAAAMLSRVYLQMEKYPEARDAANRAITVATANGKSLATSYAQAFNNSSNSSEYLFAIQVNAQDGANNMHLFWSVPEYGGRDGDVSIEDSHLNQYSAGDDRLALFYVDGSSITRSGKWQQQYKILPVIRLAEMYLTRAEGNVRAGTSIGASPLSDVNLIRSRAGLGPLGLVNLPQVLAERKLELAHEGHAIHDIKRLKQSSDGFAYNDNKLVFPIPQRDVDASGGVIVQNAGY